MHLHTWLPLFEIDNGHHSVDSYYECACGACFHVYTWAPGNIRHEHLHPADSPGAAWTRGYAEGMRRMQEGFCPERCRMTCPHGDRCRLILGHEHRTFGRTNIAIGCNFGACDCNGIITPVKYLTVPEVS